MHRFHATLVTLETLSRVYIPRGSCISNELSIYHPAHPYNPLIFVVGILAGQHPISLICKLMACSERLVILIETQTLQRFKVELKKSTEKRS